jgi:DNA-binding GntR family transcriptional regulator
MQERGAVTGDRAPRTRAATRELSAVPPGAARSSLGGKVQRELERLIVEGALQPGERLNEVALARRLGVSRGPVREAARALERTGLVTVITNRGAFVRTLTLDEAMEIYELNAVLFGFAAGQVAASVTAAQTLELRGLVEGMDRAAAATDRDAFFALNGRFHERIFAFARNRQAEAVYLDYTKKLLLLRRRSFERGASMAEANAEHRAVLDAILAGDRDLARRRAEAHSRSGRARFLCAIEHPDAETPPPAKPPARARRPATTPGGKT